MIKRATAGKTPTKVEFYGGVELIAADPESELAKMITDGFKELAKFEVVVRINRKSTVSARC
jgi:hypothetical protein